MRGAPWASPYPPPPRRVRRGRVGRGATRSPGEGRRPRRTPAALRRQGGRPPRPDRESREARGGRGRPPGVAVVTSRSRTRPARRGRDRVAEPPAHAERGPPRPRRAW
nr:MAG: hypothetical protein DIU60_07915 [Actinomycetota bacterium]